MEQIDKIVNGSYKVTEKQNLLFKLQKDFNEEIAKAIEEVEKGYKYCPTCKEYYKEKAWETKYKMENRTVRTFHSLAEFDDDKYEDKICSITYDICPMGHIIESNVTW